MRLVDANVLIYAVNTSSAHHDAARTWLDAALGGEETVGFAWSVVLAFLRLTTHPAVFAQPLDPDAATAIVRGWTEQPTARLIDPTPRHLDMLSGLLAESGTAANLVSDAHLAALAIENDAVLVTFDSDFGRFTGLRTERPGS
ncbi:MAG TPA: type II toxin-antitoxin system VapC family toxin [Candidatus Limnocylindrales bacterium]|nr:type II toxin-antitoxin system VapC family toxin [Candidatus Limnocylindrales bacterium]